MMVNEDPNVDNKNQLLLLMLRHINQRLPYLRICRPPLPSQSLSTSLRSRYRLPIIQLNTFLACVNCIGAAREMCVR